jgi:hypothetical protein
MATPVAPAPTPAPAISTPTTTAQASSLEDPQAAINSTLQELGGTVPVVTEEEPATPDLARVEPIVPPTVTDKGPTAQST